MELRHYSVSRACFFSFALVFTFVIHGATLLDSLLTGSPLLSCTLSRPLIIWYAVILTKFEAGMVYEGAPDAVSFYRVLDHIGIFYLIAGTYTPLVLLNLYAIPPFLILQELAMTTTKSKHTASWASFGFVQVRRWLPSHSPTHPSSFGNYYEVNDPLGGYTSLASRIVLPFHGLLHCFRHQVFPRSNFKDRSCSLNPQNSEY